ncbi:hypothetical protein E2C01_014040 [Portunus trituberculatus]|uniref:Uncharacterized protein n=1 Tax=Portunus trituberculatus TaxID=210409 RepID=A0A5B7DIP6_PORTR|nr:hypothetical protein [Portunus trituberculatus]
MLLGVAWRSIGSETGEEGQLSQASNTSSSSPPISSPLTGILLGRHFVLLFKTHRRHTWQVITPHRWAARVSRSLSGRRLLKSAGAETHVPPGWGVFAGCADEWSDTIGRLQHLSPAPCVITASVAGE